MNNEVDWPDVRRSANKKLSPFDLFPYGVLEAVASTSGVTVAEITGPVRTERCVRARDVVVAILRARGMSYPEIGKLLHRDHTTIMHAISRIDEMMARNPAFHEEMQSLRLALTTGKVI